MSDSLNIIKKRINSVNSLVKITNSLKMYSIATKQRISKNLLQLQEYYSRIYSIYNSTVPFVSNLIKNTDSKKLIIVFTSNMGMCGNYNNNVFKILDKLLKENNDFYIFGKRGFKYINKYSETVNIIQYSSDDLSLQKNKDLLNSIIQGIFHKYYKNTNYSNIILVYTSFIDNNTFKANTIELKPLNINIGSIQNDSLQSINTNTITINDDNKIEFINNIQYICIYSIFYASYIESTICENASRINTMSTAKKNCEELEKELSTFFNKIRQENITQSILELSGGNNE
ncbi:ATP synthase gamma chain [Bacilli bacterium]|nr:ATP synthase gamma chain [Bacilli bacterium]